MIGGGEREREIRHLVWHHMPVILALRRLKKEDAELKTSLGYIVGLRLHRDRLSKN
jgi:hypothetical protein